jgi:hypothetical protein
MADSPTLPIPAEPMTVQAGGETVTVTPARTLQILQMLRLLDGGGLAGVLAQLLGGGQSQLSLMGLLSQQGETLLGLVAVLSARPREWVEQLPPAEFMDLAAALLRVNADFFSRRLAPRLAALVRTTASTPPSEGSATDSAATAPQTEKGSAPSSA